MVTGANAHAVLVEHGRKVVGMDSFDGKAHHAAAQRQIARTVDPHARDRGERRNHQLQQSDFVRADSIHADAVEIVARRGEPYSVRDVRRARLELVR